MRIDEPEVVRAEYADERGLLGRRAAYQFAEGPDARELTFEAVAEVAPQRVLEVGCGPGELSARLAAGVGVEVVAVDLSPRMVELASGRGVDARVGDVQELPFESGAFDCAVAAWMLYVERREARGTIRFPDRLSVEAYVAASRGLVGRREVPELEMPFVVTRAPVVFVATR